MKLSSYQNLRLPNFSIHALCEVLKDADLDWHTALANAEIDPAAIDRPGGTIPAKKELAFQLQFVALTRDRVDLWAKASRAYTLGSFGIRGLVLATAPTIAAWVEAGSSTDYAFGLAEVVPLRSLDGTVIGMGFTYPDTPAELTPFSVYSDFCVIARNFTWMYGGPFPFTQVEFPLAEASPVISPLVPCTIDCGSDALRFWWAPETSVQELPFGNEFQHQTWLKADHQLLDDLRATRDWPDTVMKTIRAAPELNRKLANVAATLRVSPRTLQRKLQVTGYDFAQLRDKALCDLAADLLSETDHSVARISRILGYTDPTSFTVAFKRWNGMPPTAYREASLYKTTSQS